MLRTAGRQTGTIGTIISKLRNFESEENRIEFLKQYANIDELRNICLLFHAQEIYTFNAIREYIESLTHPPVFEFLSSSGQNVQYIYLMTCSDQSLHNDVRKITRFNMLMDMSSKENADLYYDKIMGNVPEGLTEDVVKAVWPKEFDITKKACNDTHN